jgi:hypothetical protein
MLRKADENTRAVLEGEPESRLDECLNNVDNPLDEFLRSMDDSLVEEAQHSSEYAEVLRQIIPLHNSMLTKHPCLLEHYPSACKSDTVCIFGCSETVWPPLLH